MDHEALFLRLSLYYRCTITVLSLGYRCAIVGRVTAIGNAPPPQILQRYPLYLQVTLLFSTTYYGYVQLLGLDLAP